MSCSNGLRMVRRKAIEPTLGERADDNGHSADALTAQLHGLYDSIAKEPIPDNLLDLLRQLK